MTVQRVRMFLFFLLVIVLGIRVLVEYKKPILEPIKDKDYTCRKLVIFVSAESSNVEDRFISGGNVHQLED
jgi:hypothetical protein